MDFYTIKTRPGKQKGVFEVYPDFRVIRSKDLMVKGKSFYAIWDEEKGLWSTDEFDVQRLVDDDLRRERDRLEPTLAEGSTLSVKYMSNFSTKSWSQFQLYLKNLSDNAHTLDNMLTFSNQDVKKKDYVSKRLPYPLEPGDYSAWDELVGTLYLPEEREKLEWAIGAIVEGDAKDIQKFLVLYGKAGAGKSTILNIVQKLFEGYYTTFEAKALTSASNTFSTEVFKSNPLVAIQHDGDLSRIEDNSKLNSIVSHEEMTMHEKYKPSYMSRANCFLFMATNRPVKITDAKSGIIRRLIDVMPSDKKLPANRYFALMNQIDFQLGAIAYHCLEVYRKLGKHYYDAYRPVAMMYQTDIFFNFVEDSYDVFRNAPGVSLKAAYAMWKVYQEEGGAEYKMPRYRFREELKNYFSSFEEVARVDDKQVRSWYSGFLADKFQKKTEPEKEPERIMTLEHDISLLDELLADCPAQYASASETPTTKWASVGTCLRDIDTHRLHYVKPIGKLKNLIVVDFDLRNEKGEKDPARNLAAAALWPPTYAEFSKSCGVHLHYLYDGDPDALSGVYSEGIEIKKFTGGSSLRRKLTKCNDIPVAHIASGLPLKEAKPTVSFEAVANEKALRTIIRKNLNKEYHGDTRSSIDFIHKVLEDAYASGMKYDVSDMRSAIMAFANHSTHQANYCIGKVGEMKFRSEVPSEGQAQYDYDGLIFFDVEVFPNLFLVNFKEEGEDKPCLRLINPGPTDLEPLLKRKLVGFNCRRYDNHIVYARWIGYSNEQLYNLSQKIVNGQGGFFSEAYNLSYTDVYDFSSKKQSLKKFEIELGIHHQELGLPWDQPVPEERWNEAAEYCDNDVRATEAVFHARKADWTARQILANLAGMTVNDTTNSLTARIIFGKERNPQSAFNYRFMGDIPADAVAEEGDPFTVFTPDGKPWFPGYSFENGKSTYRGEVVGEGGYVYAEPGAHYRVALLDITSMHPSSTNREQLFGPVYTPRYQDILDARVAIKHKDFQRARTMMDGKLAPYLDDESVAKDLSGALKIAINSVYGLTSARFENPFRDIRNVDNIVAKRGALFMINLKHRVQELGYTVAHIKTDSIKIPDATSEIIQFVMDYGRKYGYNFEHEATYDRMCLVNDAVYIARYSRESLNGDKAGLWTATGAEFQHPYIFKTLFSKEPLVLDDKCETKSVSTAMYLDFNEKLPEGEHNYHFVGKAGYFCPVRPGTGGGELLREKDGKYSAVGGTKGYRWKEAEVVKALNLEDSLDERYYRALTDSAIRDISQYVDFELFTDENEAAPLSVRPAI